MTAREYADQLRRILAGLDERMAIQGDLEAAVQQLLVLREHDVRELVAYVGAARACIEAMQSDLEILGQYVHSVGEWVELGMTRGQFPSRPR